MDEILTPIMDKNWRYHIKYGELLETIEYWRYTFKLYRIHEQTAWIRYKYRMFCFCPSYQAPTIALNLEYTSRRAQFLGLDEEDGHLNCGRAAKDMTTEQFRDWAFEMGKERIEEAKRNRLLAKSDRFYQIYLRD